MADVFKFVFLIAGTLAVLVSYWIAAAALFPAAVERSRSQYDAHALRITMLGVGVGVPLCMLGGAMIVQAPLPLLKLAGGALVAIPVLLALVGSAGLSQRIGAGMASAGDARQPWRRMLGGGVVLSLTFLLPVVGWFIVLPLTVLSGFGAALSSLRAPRPV